MRQRILLIDFKAVGHAIKFSLGKHRLSHKEKPTFLIYGFLMKLNVLMQKVRPGVVVYALDSKTSIRKEIYPEYKSNRINKTPQQEKLDELALPQFDELTDFVLPTLGYQNLFGAEGYEADDVIGRICKSYPNAEIVICSSDKDMYQLLTENVAILKPRDNKYYTIDNFVNEYEMEPKMWKRVKAIGGCKSDTVQGVPIPQPDPEKRQRSVAEKGACNYVNGKMKPTNSSFQAIESREGKNIINRNKGLVILPLRSTPTFKIKADKLRRAGLREVCEKYGFKAMLEDFDHWANRLRMR